MWRLTLVPLCLLPVRPATAAEKPNILFVLADDLGCGDLGCYNRDSKIRTPNLDRLAAAGLRGTDVHSPSAVCTPTRYGLLTGRYCWRTNLKSGVLQGYDPLLIEPGRMTVASLLKRHGYATCCVGKWHLGLGDVKPTDYGRLLRPGPLSVGFDYFFGIPSSLDFVPYVYVENDRVLAAPTETIAESRSQREGGGGYWRGGPIAPGFKHEDVLPKLLEKTETILANQPEGGKPFFLYLPLTAPHTPWLPTKEFRGKSRAGPYGDFAEQVDWTVGRVLESLKKHGLDKDTLVILTSDNGAHWLPSDVKQYGHVSADGRRGQKADVWEAGHRVPFLARWPGRIKPGTVSGELLCLTDLLATCADLLGVKLPPGAGEDSESLLPVLLGRKTDRPVHEAVVHHSGQGMFAIRRGDWKLVEGLGSGGFSNPRTEQPKPGGPKGQLYNLATDPAERDNRYLGEPDKVRELSELLEKYRKEGHSARRLAGR